MPKPAALIFGLLFLTLGISGFLPFLTVEQHNERLLLGIFAVDTIHNLVHIGTGLWATTAALKDEAAVLTYFKTFGLIYGCVTAFGFIQGDSVLGLIHVNQADNLFHLV